MENDRVYWKERMWHNISHFLCLLEKKFGLPKQKKPDMYDDTTIVLMYGTKPLVLICRTKPGVSVQN